MRSRNLQSWEEVTPKMHFINTGTAARMKHGTVIAVPRDLLTNNRTCGSARA
jgi:hypothetical protein